LCLFSRRRYRRRSPNPCRLSAIAGVTLLLLPLSRAAIAGVQIAATRATYRVRGSVGLQAPQIDATVEIAFTNRSGHALHEAVLVLFPNRFSLPDEGINDFNRPFVYPDEEFHPGALDVLEARDGGTAVSIEPVHQSGLPDGTVVRMPLAALSPGASRTLTLRFRTVIPMRFGTFGTFEDQLTAVGGWYPYLARLDRDGTWRTDEPPPLADFDVHLTVAPDTELVLNGRHFVHQPFASAEISSVRYLSLIAARQLLRAEATVENTHIVYLYPPPRRVSRISPEPPPTDTMLAALREIIASRPSIAPPPPRELVVVAAPLRLNLTAPGEGAVIISDRALKVHWLLRPFHELQLAQSIYAEMLRPIINSREMPADVEWVREGLSHLLARRYVSQARPGTRSVQEWIDLFNIFAIVDRFETVPKIPFVEAFFEHARSADPLRTEIMTLNVVEPPGRVILGKLRQLTGDDAFDPLIDHCTTANQAFRQCAAAESGRDLDWFFAQWLQPYPGINYRLGDVELNDRREVPGGGAGGLDHTITVIRESSRPIVEPVPVRLRSIGGHDVDLCWNGQGDSGRLTAHTPGRMYQAIIDPDHQLIEDRRDNDARPPTPQLVLDTAEVEISSTEFGISGLIVGRGRYDYHKDLAIAPFYTNRSIGFTAGARSHWGEQIDPTSYRHNLYGFYRFEALNGDFKDSRRPSVRTVGQTASLGVRYDYTNVFSFDNPTDERALRLYADWYDRSLGGDFDYVDWGASVTLTQPLLSHRSIGALQVLNGFSEPLGSSRVPNQGLYSLGGSLSIRGIGAEDTLARNILVVRTELRQDVFPEVDLNLFDLLVLRRGQLRLFADSGRVSNSAGRLYDVGSFALGVGTALAGEYEFMGFFPSVAYMAIATRVDDPSKAGEVQFLFGTRQAF
jgi:hypothetical protein